MEETELGHSIAFPFLQFHNSKHTLRFIYLELKLEDYNIYKVEKCKQKIKLKISEDK